MEEIIIEINITSRGKKFSKKYKYDRNIEMELQLRIFKKMIKKCLICDLGVK